MRLAIELLRISIFKMPTLKVTKYFNIAVVILMLNACTSIPTQQSLPKPSDPELQWLQYQQKLSTLNTWQANGVVGVVIDNNGQSANFIWKQNHRDFWLQVYGILGLGATTFVGNDGGVTMKQSNGTLKKAKNLALLMQQELGWYLPLEDLFYWARGLYNPSLPCAIQLNEYGVPESIQQQGWHINYQNYTLLAKNYPLAQRITLYHNNIKLTGVIKTWTIDA